MKNLYVRLVLWLIGPALEERESTAAVEALALREKLNEGAETHRRLLYEISKSQHRALDLLSRWDIDGMPAMREEAGRDGFGNEVVLSRTAA